MTRARFALLSLLVAVAGIGTAACFDAPEPECTFQCGNDPGAPCPDSYVCRSDGMCKRGDLPDDFACPGVTPAAPSTARPIPWY